MLALAASVADGRGLQLPASLLDPRPSDGEVARRTLREWRDAGGFWGVVRPDEPSAYLSPVYPMVIAPLIRAFGAEWLSPIVVLQALLGAATCIVAVQLGRWLVSTAVAHAVGWAAALYPLLVYQSCDVWDHCLFTFLLSLWIAVFFRALWNSGRRRWLMVGVLGGVVFLVRPVGLPVLFLMVAWVWGRGLGLRRRAAATGIILLGFGLAVAPWVLRNWQVLGQPLLLPTKGGRNLWEFNNARFSTYFQWSEPPQTLRRYGSLRDKHLSTLRRADLVEFPAFTDESEIERDAVLQRRVKTFLLANPRVYFELCWLRVGDFFRVVPLHARETLQRVGVAVPSALVLMLGALGALAAARRGPLQAKFLVCLVSLYAAVHIFTAAGITYRVPVEPYFLLLAAYGLSHLGWGRHAVDVAGGP